MTIENFTTTIMVSRADKVGFVEVQVEPQPEDLERLGIQNKDQYEAYVHYTLARDEELFRKIFPDEMPRKIYFGEQDHPEPTVQYDFAGGHSAPQPERRRVCICIFQADGGHGCVWYRE